MRGREPTTIPFSTEAMKSNLLRLQNEWATVQASHHRDAVYGYLTGVFELVTWWNQERKAVNRARRALQLRRYYLLREPEPFAAVILCTADRDQVDDRTRSKWSRALRYAAEFKAWMSRCVISSSAGVVSIGARRGLPGGIGRDRSHEPLTRALRAAETSTFAGDL
jgi:hypothetical protein